MLDRETPRGFGWLFRNRFFRRGTGFNPAIAGKVDGFAKAVRCNTTGHRRSQAEADKLWRSHILNSRELAKY
jgi:hypothetical protein